VMAMAPMSTSRSPVSNRSCSGKCSAAASSSSLGGPRCRFWRRCVDAPVPLVPSQAARNLPRAPGRAGVACLGSSESAILFAFEVCWAPDRALLCRCGLGHLRVRRVDS
jgi:hypothetical protein